MDLLVFDLDGTLLNREQTITAYTRATLEKLGERGIAYTVATGRTLHAALPCLNGHPLHLPQVYKNGVVIWEPRHRAYRDGNFLTPDEIQSVLRAFREVEITPFVGTLEPGDQPAIYHPRIADEVGRHLQSVLRRSQDVPHYDLSRLRTQARITNISALGPARAVDAIVAHLKSQDHLIAYAGESLYDPGVHWMDIHHSAASKGSALETLRHEFGFKRVICFGDSDNDASMFAMADESYAPANATDAIREQATEVIGHHDQDGIARFLRQHFRLGH